VGTATVRGVLAGGGLFGIGYHLGVIDGLRANGVELRGVPLLGTSAGSWAAAATALDVSFETLDASNFSRWPNPRRGVLAAAARSVFGDAHHLDVTVAACALPGMERTLLHGADHCLADLVAASSAVPGLLAPHTVAGRRYLDGGVRSAASVDLAGPALTLIVIEPVSGGVLGPLGWAASRRTRDEISTWRDSHHGTVVHITPDRELSATVRWPHQLFDRGLSRRAYAAGQRQGRQL
jgi:predicted acylesterase/phospholipase RssA